MTAIGFLRSIEARQASPFLAHCVERLKREGVVAHLYYTDGDCSPQDFPGVRHRIDTRDGADRIAEVLTRDSISCAATLSIPDENAVRDGFVKSRIESSGGRFVACSVEVSSILANKWETKSVLESHGIMYPDAVYVDGDLLNGRGPHYGEYPKVVLSRVRKLGFPVVAKPLWECLGNGIRVLPDDNALTDFLNAPPAGNFILEQCVTGTLCSLEVLSYHGECFFQPLVWKGEAGGQPSFPFTQVRHAVAGDRPGPLEEVRQSIAAFCANSGVEGAIEFEFIFDDLFHCIEVNPRTSGSTGISIATSGVNTYYEIARMAMGNWDPPRVGTVATELAFQFPVTLPLPPTELVERSNVHRWDHFTVEDDVYRNALVSVSLPQLRVFEDWLTNKATNIGAMAPDTVSALVEATSKYH